MNTGIIVYSQTGNTLSVAKKLEQTLKTNGNMVKVERVELENSDTRSSEPVKLKSAPDVGSFETLIFASPVHAFSLAPAMKAYLSQISSLSGKRVCCFVTQQFKWAWLGGNRTVRQIESICKQKGAEIKASGVVNWSSNMRDQQVEDVVSKLSAL